ncbi:MAG TPA: hypothetical protein RMH85_33810 [Polyangiaceae bacterium LLY-WYZ-15_(1-7)]|nr:hypothetical protein [Sandaracinus sp.]MBJ73450.1 hypothetical protein [Sandaracinus sp.]HJL00843.1 hypothetical protein [Polyangiaceae bacterium LLY-WYZ-15_(1-7)]HJL13509.1 hypothetical protein [Polyangiaceae bacterium LLY-WYZ-15_(1-7)]
MSASRSENTDAARAKARPPDTRPPGPGEAKLLHGRERLVELLESLVEEEAPRLVLVGPPGVGRRTLARAVASRHARCALEDEAGAASATTPLAFAAPGEPLPEGVPVHVPPLTREAARATLEALAARRGVPLEELAIEELLDLAGGLPGLLDHFVRELVSRPWSEIREQTLAGRLPAPLAAWIDARVAELDAPTRRALEQLACAPRPQPAAALARAGVPPEALEALVERGLARRTADRRFVALGPWILGAAPRDPEVLERAAEALVVQAGEPVKDPRLLPHWFAMAAWLVTLCRGHGLPAPAARLGAAALDLAHCALRGHPLVGWLEEQLQLLEPRLREPVRLGLRLEVLLVLADEALLVRRLERAPELLDAVDEALGRSEALENEEALARRAARQRAALRHTEGELAPEHLATLRTLWEARDTSTPEETMRLALLLASAAKPEDPEEAMRVIAYALPLAEARGWSLAERRLRVLAGDIDSDRGDLRAAASQYEQAARRAEELGLKEALLHRGSAAVARWAAGEDGREALDEVIEALRTHAPPRMAAYFGAYRAMLRAADGDLQGPFEAIADSYPLLLEAYPRVAEVVMLFRGLGELRIGREAIGLRRVEEVAEGGGASEALARELLRWHRSPGEAFRGPPRSLEERLLVAAIARGEEPAGADAEARWTVDRDGRWLEGPEGRVSLARRAVLRRLLARLAEAAWQSEGPVDVPTIVEATWPGERLLPDAAAARVYTAVRSLRKLGLEGALHTTGDGYALDPAVRVQG